MITEKDIQTRTAEILANAGFNVVASEVDEGFLNRQCLFLRILQMYSLSAVAVHLRNLLFR